MGIIAALGLSAAIVYGSSDFLGGFASQRMTSLEVTFVAFAVGTLTCVALLPLAGSHWSLAALGYGTLAGVTAAGSIWLLYSALAMGPVSVCSRRRSRSSQGSFRSSTG